MLLLPTPIIAPRSGMENNRVAFKRDNCSNVNQPKLNSWAALGAAKTQLPV
jgi:hypothetical protein